MKKEFMQIILLKSYSRIFYKYFVVIGINSDEKVAKMAENNCKMHLRFNEVWEIKDIRYKIKNCFFF